MGFTSPSAALPCLHVEEGEGMVELRHVRTIRMVLERRIVSSEVFDGGRLIDAKMWEVSALVWVCVCVCGVCKVQMWI